MTVRIALLHPGEMGATIGACARAAGYPVGWAAEERSGTTMQRATGAGLKAYPTRVELLEQADMVIAVCPPDAARQTAGHVAETGFRGIYVDANAISPRSARAVADTVEAGGATYVDGGIIGPPATEAGTTRIYLSGARAREVAACFTGTRLEAIDIGPERTAASALKMCYAAWTKGSAALLLAVRALARAEAVEKTLCAEWGRSLPGLESRSETAGAVNAPKAWRFVGEMQEIVGAFDDSGLPGDFHRGAARIFDALASFRYRARPADLDDVLCAILDAGEDVPV